jgi:tRNA A37 threonylcarbamoyladenosine dehydratase
VADERERERALGVQTELTSVANEVVVLVMVGGAGSTAVRGLRRPARRRGRGRRRWIRVNLL